MSDEHPIPTVRLGRNGPTVSALGIGTWAWGDRMLWGYGRGYGDADLRAAFEVSLRAGITFFDTAEVYGMGRSERLLGEFIRSAQVPVAVTTKFFPFPWRFGRQAVVRALRRSLQRLGLPQVDLYLIHWPTPLVPVEVLAQGLGDALEAGLTKAVGVSNFSVQQMQRAQTVLAARGMTLAANQVEYSLLVRKAERNGLFDLCRELGATLIAYSPLGMGLLSGKYTPDNPPPGVRGRRYSRDLLAKIQPLIALLREIGAAHGGKTPAQVALNWVIAKGALPIPGAKNARQAEENAGAIGWLLDRDEVAALDAASQNL